MDPREAGHGVYTIIIDRGQKETERKNEEDQTALSPGRPEKGSLGSGNIYKDMDMSKIKYLVSF